MFSILEFIKGKKKAPLNSAAFCFLLELQTLHDIPAAIITVPTAKAAQSFHACLAYYSIYTRIALAFLSS